MCFYGMKNEAEKTWQGILYINFTQIKIEEIPKIYS